MTVRWFYVWFPNNWLWLRKTPWENTCIRYVYSQFCYSDLSKVCEIRVVELIKLLLYVLLVDGPPAWLATHQLCLHTSTATVLFANPRDVTVEANQWAQFNCTVSCSYTRGVGWYMAGYDHTIRRNNTIPGLLIKRSPTKCISNQKIHYFEVYATEAFNKSAFYCAAYERHHQERSCSCGTGGRCYSRPALLTGEPVCNAA